MIFLQFWLKKRPDCQKMMGYKFSDLTLPICGPYMWSLYGYFVLKLLFCSSGLSRDQTVRKWWGSNFQTPTTYMESLYGGSYPVRYPSPPPPLRSSRRIVAKIVCFFAVLAIKGTRLSKNDEVQFFRPHTLYGGSYTFRTPAPNCQCTYVYHWSLDFQNFRVIL